MEEFLTALLEIHTDLATRTFMKGAMATFEKLSPLLGISKKHRDNLPDKEKEKILKGDVSSLMVSSVTTDKGEKVTLPYKFQMKPGKNGDVNMVVYPVNKELKTDFKLSENELKSLRKGHIVTHTHNGKELFLQYDRDTNKIAHANKAEVMMSLQKQSLEERLKNSEVGSKLSDKDVTCIKDIHLGPEQTQTLREGKAVTLKIGETEVTMGVDIKSGDGFKILEGNLNDWDIKRQREYDEAHPEYVGLVATDENRWEYQNVVDLMSGRTNGESQSVKNSNDQKVSSGTSMKR